MTEHKDEIGLDAFFDAARAETPRASQEFLDRIEVQALATLPPAIRVQNARPTLNLWRQFLQSVGGWPGAAGLATACAAGLWIGVVQPDSLTAIWPLVQGAELGALGVDPLSGFDLAMMEG